MKLKTIKILVVGTRTYSNYDEFVYVLEKMIRKLDKKFIIEFVSGGAKGADEMVKNYALANFYPYKEFPADWNFYGNSAGYKRNAQMWDYADLGIAFWDGISKGTKHSFRLSGERDKKFYIYNYKTKKTINSEIY